MTKTILIVEDMYGEFLEEIIKRFGYCPILYSNGNEAFSDVRDKIVKYDLAFIDLSLPGCGGDQVIEISKEVYPSVPVICISGYKTQSTKADQHIVKPFEPSFLRQIISGYISQELK